MDEQTKAQIAKVILLHGTPEQQKEVEEYLRKPSMESMDVQQFQLAMDKQSPNWFVDLADFRDLHTFALQQLREPERLIDHRNALRRSTGNRLFVCARATFQR